MINPNLIEHINIQIFPVILMPVSALLTLVFYNRLASINLRIRTTQKELRDTLQIEKPSLKEEELIHLLKKESGLLYRRAKKVRITLSSILFGLFVFTLTSLSIALAVYWPICLEIALFMWLIGPFFICFGLFFGVYELTTSFQPYHLHTSLIEKWQE